MRFFILLCFCFSFLSMRGYAQFDPQVTIFPLPKKNTPSQHLIQKKEVKQLQLQSLESALSHVTGASIDSLGDNGRTSTVSIRGGKAKHTLVLLDDIPLNSPEGQSVFDFGTLSAYSFESILLEKGSQSVRYGPQAMGGVVHLSTLASKSHSESPNLLFHGETGNDHTLRGHSKIHHTFENGKGAFQMSAGAHTQGKGSFINKKHGNEQADDFSGYEGIFSLRLNPTSHARITVTSFWQQDSLRIDDGGKAPPVISDQVQETRRLALGVTGQFDSPHHRWTHKVQGLYFRGKYRVSKDNPLFAAHSHNIVARYELTGDVYCGHRLTTGLEWRSQSLENSFDSDHSNRSGAAYALYEFEPWERWRMNLGVRHDHPQDFKNVTTWHVKGQYEVSGNTTLYGGVSTGFKTPSPEDIIGGNLAKANPDLKPEYSVHADLGLSHQMTRNTSFSGALFFLSLKDLVEGVQLDDGTWQAQNSNRKAYGIELSMTHKVGRLSFDGNYTLTLARNGFDNNHQPRRLPRHVVGGTVKYTFDQEKAVAFAQLTYTSSTRDRIAILKKNTILPEIWKVRLGGHYQITPRMKIFGRIENALDRSFENSFGYGHKGRTLYLGLEAKL
jgi:vitamin B12 transporter